MLPQEIQSNPTIVEKLNGVRLKPVHIKRCLTDGEPLINHIVDFDQYATAWKEVSAQKKGLRIQASVLWSFGEEGSINMAKLAARRIAKPGEDVRYVITAPIEWTDVTLGPSVSAKRVTFEAEINFMHTKFVGPIVFDYANLGDHANFTHTNFGDDAHFRHATFGDFAYFGFVTFSRSASFGSATFGDLAHFNGTSFGDGARFNTATFGSHAGFNNATFGSHADFEDATFGNEAQFHNAIFEDQTDFDRTKFGNNARFRRATFLHRADFNGANFYGDSHFRHVAFRDFADFGNTRFKGNADFHNTTFGGDSNFRSTHVKRGIFLKGTNWKGRADFRNAVIEALRWDSDNRPSSVEGIFDGREAELKSVVINNVFFSDLVDLSYAELGGTGKVVFENVIFEKAADFLRTRFWNDAIFVRNRFRGLWDLTSAIFQNRKTDNDELEKKSRLCLSFNHISRLVMDGEHLYGEQLGRVFHNLSPSFPLEESRIRAVKIERRKSFSCADLDRSQDKNEQLSKIYKTLELSFREGNNRRSENEAWYLGMVAARDTENAKMKSWVPWILMDVPSRYGIDPLRVGLLSVVLVLLFTILYWLCFYIQISIKKQQLLVSLAPPPEPRHALRFRPFEQFLASIDKQTRSIHPLRDAMYLSGRAFFKLGFGTTYPCWHAVLWIAYIEWALGIFMLVHLLFAVKNTLPIALPFLSG